MENITDNTITPIDNTSLNKNEDNEDNNNTINDNNLLKRKSSSSPTEEENLSIKKKNSLAELTQHLEKLNDESIFSAIAPSVPVRSTSLEKSYSTIDVPKSIDIDDILEDLEEFKNTVQKSTTSKFNPDQFKELEEQARSEIRNINQNLDAQSIAKKYELKIITIKTKGKNCTDKEWKMNEKNNFLYVSYLFFYLIFVIYINQYE